MIHRYAYNQSADPWGSKGPMPPNHPNIKLARAYVPYQIYNESYPPKEALEKGTMFPELYQPYHGPKNMGM